jgi:SP family arabinose:H+ symporter-like MFS transporter
MNVLISGVFLVLARQSGAYPFMFFASMMVLQLFVVLFMFPERKEVTLEQMRYRLGIE